MRARIVSRDINALNTELVVIRPRMSDLLCFDDVMVILQYRDRGLQCTCNRELPKSKTTIRLSDMNNHNLVAIS